MYWDTDTNLKFTYTTYKFMDGKIQEVDECLKVKVERLSKKDWLLTIMMNLLFLFLITAFLGIPIFMGIYFTTYNLYSVFTFPAIILILLIFCIYANDFIVAFSDETYSYYSTIYKTLIKEYQQKDILLAKQQYKNWIINNPTEFIIQQLRGTDKQCANMIDLISDIIHHNIKI